MARSAYVLAVLLIPAAAVAQTATTTQGPDGRTLTVITTQLPDGSFRSDISAPQGGVVTGVVPPAGAPTRDTRPVTGTSVIRGRVVDGSSGIALRKAVVQIFSPDMREPRSATTDLEGRYEFTDLPAGQFNITVNKAGYINLTYGQLAPNEVGKALRVGDKQVVEKIDFSLPHGAVITGRVLDEYGEPIADVQVAALRNQFSANGPRPVSAGRGATTNDIGEFRLFGLPPGQYLLSAAYRQQMINGPTTIDSSGYAITYYPGTANLADAQKLTIGLGGSVSDVTLMLVAARTARVSGSVVDAQGRAVHQGSVMLMSRNANMAMTTSSGPIRPDGTFTINGVTPGEYTMRGMMPGGQPTAPPEIAIATISVNGVDITDVLLQPARPITVSGRVVLDPVAARSFTPETVRVSAPLSDPGPIFGPPPPPAAVRDDLTFAFNATPGPAIVRATVTAPGSSWMIKSVTLNGADVTDGITLRNEDVTGLEIELTNRVPDVSGLVTDGKGDPVREYFAIAFPQDQDRWNALGPGRAAMVRPDEQGRFRFRTLRPGNYYIAAVEHLQNGEWMDPAFMDSVHTRATRISINEGDTQTLDLKLIQLR